MRIIAIGGEPATGKTTLIKKLKNNVKVEILKYRPEALRRLGTLNYEVDHKNKAIYWGVYDGSIFDGTDRLSRSVHPIAKKFLGVARRKYKNYTLIFEGERLFGLKFLKKVMACRCPKIILVVTAKKHIKVKRHIKRKDEQTDKFLQSCATRISRLLEVFPHVELANNSKTDLEKNVKYIKRLLKSNDKKFTEASALGHS